MGVMKQLALAKAENDQLSHQYQELLEWCEEVARDVGDLQEQCDQLERRLIRVELVNT